VSNGTIALNNTAESLIFIGELDAAEKVLAEVQEISRRFGLLTRQSVALGLSGMVLAHRGRWTEALSVWKQADELGVKTGYAEHHGTYLILRTEGCCTRETSQRPRRRSPSSRRTPPHRSRSGPPSSWG